MTKVWNLKKFMQLTNILNHILNLKIQILPMMIINQIITIKNLNLEDILIMQDLLITKNLPNIPLIPMMMMSMNQNLLRFTLVIIVMLPQQKIQIQNTPNPKYINKNLKLIILNPNLQRMNIPN